MASKFEYLDTDNKWKSRYRVDVMNDPLPDPDDPISYNLLPEVEYIRFTLIDSLYEPQTLSIALRNSRDNELNVLEGVLKRFQKVRLIEGETGNVIFYGKINRIGSELDASYGQLLNVSALDNLQELASKTISSNAEYESDTRRSTIIRDIISGGTGDKHLKLIFKTLIILLHLSVIHLTLINLRTLLLIQTMKAL